MIWKMLKPKTKKGPLTDFIPYKNFSINYEDVKRRIPDVSKALKLLSFKPEVELEQGLPITIKWQRQFVK